MFVSHFCQRCNNQVTLLSFQLRRIRAVANQSRELPVVDMGHSVDEFFLDLEKTSQEGRKLPAWHGELYLEVRRFTILDVWILISHRS